MAIRKLRIAHVITQLELGGAQRNTLYTVGHLDRSRFEPSLWTGPGGILDAEVTACNASTAFVPSLQRAIHPIRDFASFIELYRAFRRTRPHVVHTHSSKAGILGRVAAYLAGVPVIVHTFHGFGFTPTQGPRKHQFYVALERFCAMLSTHLVFVSEDNRQEASAKRISNPNTMSLIRSGIAMAAAEPAAVRSELGIPADAWIVMSTGNFKPQKNPMELVRVACELAARDTAIHILLAGDGKLRKDAERFVAESGRASQVHFLGWRHDIGALLAASNAFLLVSLWEGLPRALVEAFASGVPAVAYAVNGVKDILIDHETGFAITPHDTASAVEKLLWLKNNPEDAKLLGLAARRRVEKEFDIEQMVRDQESLYEKLWAQVPLKEHYERLWETAGPRIQTDSV